MTRIAVVEPFLGGSHRSWAEGYATHSAHDVSVVGLPPKHWKWRMQGAHVTLAERLAADAAANGPFDVLLCSDMVDVAGLVGVLRGRAGDPRVVLYLHENQLTFPLPPDEQRDLTYAMTNWTSMLAADLVVFNSEFHRIEWFDALPRFLRRFPDERHSPMVARVRSRSIVLPVGVAVDEIRAVPAERRERPLVLWNQRWQWDKGRDRFVRAVSDLAVRRGDVDVAVAGDRGDDDRGLAELRSALGECLVHDGPAPRAEYLRLLRAADVVVSTARHEFFGVAVVEAVVAGAFPVLPNGLAYPGHVPERHHDRCLYEDGDGLLERLEWAIDHRHASQGVAADLARHVECYDWPTVAAAYDAALV